MLKFDEDSDISSFDRYFHKLSAFVSQKHQWIGFEIP